MKIFDQNRYKKVYSFFRDAPSPVYELEIHANEVSYDNTLTGLSGSNVQTAFDELYEQFISGSTSTISGSASDISYSTGTSGLSASNVQDAIDELAARHIAGDAADISYDPSESGLTATDVQEAIDELAARPTGGGDSFVLASETIDLPPASSPHDALVYTMPACIDATITFVLLSVEEQLQGTGDITVRVGTTAGDDDLIIDQVIDSTTPKGNVGGKDISTLGAAWPASSGYVWSPSEGDEIHVRVTTNGTVDSGKIRVTVVGVVIQ